MRLSEEEAIRIVGKRNVKKVKNEICTVNDSGEGVFVELSARIECTTLSGEECTLVANYYQDKAFFDCVGGVDFQYCGYVHCDFEIY